MNKHFKLLSVVFAVAMLLGALLSGCASKAPTASAPAESAAESAPAESAPAESAAAPDTANLEPYTLDWLFLCDGADDGIAAVQDAANKILQPKINATLNINMQSWGDYPNKVSTLLGSGEKVDLAFTAQWENLQTWVRQGYFMDVTDLMTQLAPETVKMLGDIFVKGSAIDGKNYGVPTLKETCVPGGLIFNNKLLQQYGWDKNSITTLADFSKLEPWLAQVKKDNPTDFTPYLTEGAWYVGPFVSVGVLGDDCVVYYDSRDHKVRDVWETPEMKEHLDLMRKWNVAGYMNPDCANATFNVSDIYTTGKFFVGPQPVKGDNVKADELEAYNADSSADYVDNEFAETRYTVTNHVAGSLQAIPVTSEDPERAMMFLELLHTDADLINTLSFGIEGTNYTKTDKEGIIQLVADKKWQGKLPQWMLGNVYLQYITTDEDPTKNDKLKAMSEKSTSNFTNGFYFDPTPVETQIAAITSAQAQYEQGLRTGTLDPATTLDKQIKLMKDNGMDAVVAEVQKQLDAWLAKTAG